MTTLQDKGRTGDNPPMLRCDLNTTNTYSSLTLALRDMRTANGRDPATGAGVGNESWIGLSLGMIVLDTLSGSNTDVGARFRGLLTDHDVEEGDARYVYKFRCSLLHGYGIPKPASVDGRRLIASPEVNAYAVDTSHPDRIVVSVPAFCGRLVERIAYTAPQRWDTALINTNLTIGS
ncbi:hypothetical protein Q5425_32040 [Amycolatopsis sp. A133]|uniref:hypothetical protein n=1 Tax=Amycolatopsis sp. A133 TaxID=3064472 RepID=UPI0027E809DF|nr:hypothetical protein [Amycolatopsis sp. A133]MDQ7808389.1 hypothetical protein [Amycolatopsis sp. A133]